MGVTERYWGNLNLDELSRIVRESNKDVVHEYKGTNEIEILGTEFDGENLAIEIKWNGFNTIARLKPSNYKDGNIDKLDIPF